MINTKLGIKIKVYLKWEKKLQQITNTKLLAITTKYTKFKIIT